MAANELKPVDKVIESWMTVTVDRFQESLMKHNVGEPDGQLMRSFTIELQRNGGNAFHAIIKFLAYGRMVDMGVGRGHKLGSTGIIKSASGNRYQGGMREKKSWYSKTKTREIAILRFILAKNYSVFSLKALETELKAINKTGN